MDLKLLLIADLCLVFYVCGVLSCYPPARNSHTTYTPYKNAYNIGDTVRYSCSNGYTLVGGTVVRTCLSSQGWSGYALRCEGKKKKRFVYGQNNGSKKFLRAIGTGPLVVVRTRL